MNNMLKCGVGNERLVGGDLWLWMRNEERKSVRTCGDRWECWVNERR